MTSIELLSPARNLTCGMAAIDHGADAVYIGAPNHGARAAACNPTEDIARLCDYAHRFGAKVYVTLNTILYDDELEAARLMAWDLYRAGTDAFIVQDPALLEMAMPPIPLHASTQMDNRTREKAEWLRRLGFEQMVLARELSLEETRAIHEAVPEMKLEAFCHGALCVSYSGQCYASQYCFGRSANRGECAQFCRLPFSLEDSEGRTLIRDKYLLSLRDMNRLAHLEAMMDAGIRSFKIEGRLKDVAYVKNVTASYRTALDHIMKRRPEYCRSSFGASQYTFRPDLSRAFSRGGTDYFLRGRTVDMASPDTPKSRGREVGTVKEVGRGSITVATSESFSNGDGLCFIGRNGKLEGFRVNRAEGNRLYPATMPDVRKKDRLWRSFDRQWERMMSGKTATRRIPARIMIEEAGNGFRLTFDADDGSHRELSVKAQHQTALKDQTAGIRDVLGKLGDTQYACESITIRFTQPWFIPKSLLAEWRRQLTQDCGGKRECQPTNAECTSRPHEYAPVTWGNDFRLNVSNKLSKRFYEQCGCKPTDLALEVKPQTGQLPLMTCRFCIRHARGWCKKQDKGGDAPRDPLFLVSNDGRRFRLHFDCKRCEMTVLTS